MASLSALDTLIDLAQRDHVQRTDNGTTHLSFGDAIMRQHIGLALRRGTAMATHRRNHKRFQSDLKKVSHRRTHNCCDVGNPAAASPNRNARTCGKTAAGLRSRKLLANRRIHVSQLPAGKVLKNRYELR